MLLISDVIDAWLVAQGAGSDPGTARNEDLVARAHADDRGLFIDVAFVGKSHFQLALGHGKQLVALLDATRQGQRQARCRCPALQGVARAGPLPLDVLLNHWGGKLATPKVVSVLMRA